MMKTSKTKRIGDSKAIEAAVAAGMNIINVRYIDCGGTVPAIVEALECVEYSTVDKWCDDATEFLKELLSPGDTCVLCGVNTDCCVSDTAHGLAKAGHTVHVLRDASGSASHLREYDPGEEEIALRDMAENPGDACEGWFRRNSRMALTVDQILSLGQAADIIGTGGGTDVGLSDLVC